MRDDHAVTVPAALNITHGAGCLGRPQGARAHLFLIAITTALLMGANLVIWFPGESGPDSHSQYAQAIAGQFDDWHPPIMAWLWSWFRVFGDGDGPMFCFQIVFYWLGFGVIAIAFVQAGRLLPAWAMLAIALFPSLLTLNGVLLKDVSMGVTLLTAFAGLFWCRMQNRRFFPPVAVVCLMLLLYGALVRANAVFALVPLLVYMMRPQLLSRPWWVLAISIPVSLAIVPAANLFNHRVLLAEPLGPIRSLQIFDMTGISYYSGDLAVFASKSISRNDVTKCYTPVGWDRLAPWGECRFFWNRLAASPDLEGFVEKVDARTAMSAEPNPDLAKLWVAAIVRHPVAYAKHRLTHFSSEIQRGASIGSDAAARKPLYIVLYDLITASGLWLAVGTGLLIQLTRACSVRRTAPIEAALALLLSGLCYGSAYLIVGVATELRYLYWSLIAIFTALVISLSETFERASVGFIAASARCCSGSEGALDPSRDALQSDCGISLRSRDYDAASGRAEPEEAQEGSRGTDLWQASQTRAGKLALLLQASNAWTSG